jgi:serine protease Do
MSDERLNFDTSNETVTSNGAQEPVDQNIVESTAEVISESVTTEAPSGEAAKEEAPTYSYETYSTNTSTNEYMHADAGSATGNGSYQYSGANHEYYQGENYGSSVGSGTGGNGNGNRGGRGKGFLAVVLAIIFGACIGAGFWGVHRYVGKTSAAETAIADAAGNQDSSITGEQKEEEPAEAPAEEAPQAEEQAPAQDPAAEQDAQAAQEQPAETTAPQTQNAGSFEQAEGIKNEAGLIIADTETPDTELTRVVDQVMPSIVSVYNDFTQEVQTFYGQTYTRQGESTGSGIIIGKTDSELLIVTNNHVVEGADNLRVLFIDQETCNAEIKGTDPSNDLAVIAVPLESIKDTTQGQIKVATLGNSDNLKIGEDVIAIGNALGYGQSVTTGIVSANNREISDETITGTFIQTDAAINPGNSGGALVNINGNVIGINSSKIGGDTVEGMGFAIPITRAIPIIEELMNRETLSKVDEAEQGTIGISGATVTSDVSKAYNMPVGVYVAQILENGGAATSNSDLREGDIITAINGQSISSMEELQKMLQYYKAGTEVTLTVQRQDGQGSYAEAEVKVTLGTRASIENQQQNDQQNGQPQNGQQEQVDPNMPDQNGGQNGNNGQDGQNGYNGQSGNGQGSYYNPFEQFGFPFGN